MSTNLLRDTSINAVLFGIGAVFIDGCHFFGLSFPANVLDRELTTDGEGLFERIFYAFLKVGKNQI